MVGLPESEKILNICLFVLTECTNVTDTQTDRRTDYTFCMFKGKLIDDETVAGESIGDTGWKTVEDVIRGSCG